MKVFKTVFAVMLSYIIFHSEARAGEHDLKCVGESIAVGGGYRALAERVSPGQYKVKIESVGMAGVKAKFEGYTNLILSSGRCPLTDGFSAGENALQFDPDGVRLLKVQGENVSSGGGFPSRPPMDKMACEISDDFLEDLKSICG